MDIKTENEWQRYNRILIPAGSRKRKKQKPFSITQEALDLAKQDFLNRGGEIEVLEPSHVSCEYEDDDTTRVAVEACGSGRLIARNYPEGYYV